MSFADDPRRLDFSGAPKHDALELASSRDPSVPLRDADLTRGRTPRQDSTREDSSRARERDSTRGGTSARDSTRDDPSRERDAGRGGASQRDSAYDAPSRERGSAPNQRPAPARGRSDQPLFAPDQTESEQAAAREQIFSRGQKWTRDQAVREQAARASMTRAARGGDHDAPREQGSARDGSTREQPAARDDAAAGEEQVGRAAKRQPQVPARLIEERAARTKADPRRDPTMPGSLPARGGAGPVGRGAEATVRPPRTGAQDARQPANANASKYQPGMQRTAAAQAHRDRMSDPGSVPPRTAAPDRASPVAQATTTGASRAAEHAAASAKARAAAPDGRKFPSQHGANPDPRTSAAPEARASRAPDGREFPGQPGANTPDPRAGAAPADRMSRPEPRAAAGDARRSPSPPGAADARTNATPDGRKFPSQTGANAPNAQPRTALGDRMSQPEPRAPEPRTSDARKFPSEPGTRAAKSTPSTTDNKQSRAPQSGRGIVSRPDPRRSAQPAGAARPLLAAHGGGNALRSIRPPSDSRLYCEVDRLAVEIQYRDLSAGGLFVQTPAPPPVDSEVAVFLRIGSFQLEASGHVVQSTSLDAAKRERRRPGFGLLFTRIDDTARGALRDALEVLTAERAERDHDYDSSRPPTNPRIDFSAEPAGAARPTAPPRARTNQRAPHESPAQIAPRVSRAEKTEAAPTPPDPKEQELLAKLTTELAAVESQPPWTVLGISQGADQGAARTAYLTASKRYHPHAFARYALPEIKTVVTKLFIVYKRAFTTLTKTGRGGRNAARAVVSGNPPGRSSDPGNR